MPKALNFIGLGISMGQDHAGPGKAHRNISQYTSTLQLMGLRFTPCGEVVQTHQNPKIKSYHNLSEVDWSIYEKASHLCNRILRKKTPLLNWGGDHSVAISTVSAFCSLYSDGYVVWIDAHADTNLPPSSPSGNLHGMPLAILMNVENIAENFFPWIKKFLSPEKIIYVGLRDVDFHEKELIKKKNIRFYSADHVRQRGMRAVADEILAITKDNPLHISFDIDSVCPKYAPATGLHVPDGLTPQDLFTLGTRLSVHSNITSMDVVEINPAIGTKEEIFKTNLMALSFVRWTFCRYQKNEKEYRYDDYRTNEEFDPTETEQSL